MGSIDQSVTAGAKSCSLRSLGRRGKGHLPLELLLARALMLKCMPQKLSEAYTAAVRDPAPQATVWKGAKPWVSWMMPATDPTAATMLMSQQKKLRLCSAIQYGENILTFFCTMCIWICIRTKICQQRGPKNSKGNSRQHPDMQ